MKNLKLEIQGRESENYNLMIAWWNYHTKLSWIATSSWQVDTFIPTRESLQINFDDKKTWSYNLDIRDFELKKDYFIYLGNLDVIKEAQIYEIDWKQMEKNKDKGVIYKVDKNWNGKFESNEEVKIKYKKWEDDQGENKDGNSNWGNWKSSWWWKWNNNQQ
jgi:hypothetical protein